MFNGIHVHLGVFSVIVFSYDRRGEIIKWGECCACHSEMMQPLTGCMSMKCAYFDDKLNEVHFLTWGHLTPYQMPVD